MYLARIRSSSKREKFCADTRARWTSKCNPRKKRNALLRRRGDFALEFSWVFICQGSGKPTSGSPELPVIKLSFVMKSYFTLFLMGLENVTQVAQHGFVSRMVRLGRI